MNEHCWCVYIHTAPNGKKYVGITSQSVNERWRYGKGYKENSYFARAIRKYGWDNIIHEVVAENLSEDSAKNMEIALIKQYNTTNRDYGYNISAGGDGTTGVQHFGSDNAFYGKHHSEDVKVEIANRVKNAWADGLYDDSICRPIYQFDMDGNLVGIYKSIRQAEDETAISHSVISRVCCGKLNYTHGFTWAYQDNCADLQAFQRDFLQRIDVKKQNFAKHLRKAVELYDLQGKHIGTYESASQLSRELGVHKDTVAYACRNGNILQGTYRCNYAQEETN